MQVKERAEPAAKELAKGISEAAKRIGDDAVPIAEDATKEISKAAKTVKEEAPKKAEEYSRKAEQQAEDIAKQAKPTADKAAKQVQVCISAEKSFQLNRTPACCLHKSASSLPFLFGFVSSLPKCSILVCTNLLDTSLARPLCKACKFRGSGR